MSQKTSSAEEGTSRDQPGTSAQQTPKRFVCDVCGRPYAKEYTLILHKRTHSELKSYPCSHCGKVFNQRGNLNVHTRSQTEGGPHQCPVCRESFSTKCLLTQHRATIHVVKKPHKCTQCAKSFQTKRQLNAHKLTHLGIKPFKCDHCEKSFARKHTLKNHVQSKHEKENQYRCRHCKRQFSTLQRYRRHVQMLHNILRKLNSIDLTKPELAQSFDSKLRKFARGETPKCNQCGLLFLFTSGLIRHFSTHFKTNPLVFGHGRKALKYLRIWRYHSHKHKGLLRKLLLRWRTYNWISAPISRRTKAFYKCILCSRNFYRPSQFINHMQRHKDEEPLVYRVNSHIFRENPI